MSNNEIRDQKGSKLTILQTLRIQGSMSRIELTRITGLSRATISISIAELIENDLVCETDNRLSTKGRPATALELVPNSRVIIGADLDNKTWTLGAFDLLGNVIKSMKIPVYTFEPEETFKALAIEISSFVKGLDKSPIPLLGLGVPGLVDANHRMIRSAADLEWNQVDVAGIMEKEIGWPTVVVNRHRARGLTECRYGSGLSYNNMIYIGVGMGIAAGLYINRQLLSGSLGGAGEIGHTTIEPSGPLCPCGNHGCLQVLAAGPAIEQEFRKLVRSSEHELVYPYQNIDLQFLKMHDVCAAAEDDDKLAVQVISNAASYLGIAMANLLNTFNPEAIILGGTIPNASTLFVETATKVMRQRAMRPLSADTIVKTSVFKDIGGALGAANFAFDKNISISIFN
ncbi:Sugar kinase of the NBD/HSP70 family, may contain an N-terminal HTH domain [Paenibacillus sp. 1_12]|uniref:ROK family protein n=1 Tax=Paenibacillus sp. 1_12 TaxID=1566278 RepID=UPI0008E7BF14|nr:ROK family transcriptional regulator [Paenibacillus sp. 1_12]SFL36429.1 Sugar kinase of the NBD/HSP70 family, may contain an N-terminal HTH domain [Paenibacillus sp. 1_12]